MTMRIKSTHPESQGEYVIIEDEDFNPDTMELYDEEPATGPTREEMKTFLTIKGVEFANNIKTTALAELYAAEVAKGE